MRRSMLTIVISFTLAQSRTIQLSNVALPRDQHGNPIMTGETDVLSHDGSFYVYVNNWGGCADVDCCTTSAASL